ESQPRARLSRRPDGGPGAGQAGSDLLSWEGRTRVRSEGWIERGRRPSLAGGVPLSSPPHRGPGADPDSTRDDNSRPPASREGIGGAPDPWPRGGYAAMAAEVDRPGDSSSERSSPEASKPRLRDQSQLDFEVDFFGRLLDRDPYFVDAL